jgi:hypothetical protein
MNVAYRGCFHIDIKLLEHELELKGVYFTLSFYKIKKAILKVLFLGLLK